MANKAPVNMWKKGDKSPNPFGRPKREWTWASLFEEAMEEEMADASEGKKNKIKKIITKKLAKMAMSGDITAIKEITNRMDGMPTQHTTVQTVEESDLDTIEQSNYAELAQQAHKQMVEDEQPVQDQEQAGTTSDLSPEQSTTPAPSAEVIPQIQPDTQS